MLKAYFSALIFFFCYFLIVCIRAWNVHTNSSRIFLYMSSCTQANEQKSIIISESGVWILVVFMNCVSEGRKWVRTPLWADTCLRHSWGNLNSLAQFLNQFKSCYSSAGMLLPPSPLKSMGHTVVPSWDLCFRIHGL